MQAPIARRGTTERDLNVGSPEAEQWDRFVAATPGGDLVQTSAWVRTKRAIGFKVHHAVVYRGCDIMGGAYIIARQFGPLGAVGYVARGPLIAAGAGARETASVLDEVEYVAWAAGIRHLIVQPPEDDNCVASTLTARGYRPGAPAVAPTATLRLDLSPNLDRIFAGLSPGKRRQIRRSRQAGIEVRIGDRGDIDLFHTLHEKTARMQGFAPVSRAYLHHQWNALHPIGSVQLFLARYRDRTLAAFWLTAFGNTVTDRLSGWVGEDRRLQANAACQWAAICWAKGQGYRRYDFGGVNRCYAQMMITGEPLPEEFHRSPDAFKREFGPAPVLLPMAMHRAFGPVGCLVLRTVYPFVADRLLFHRFLNRLRSKSHIELPYCFPDGVGCSG
ncbi:lipid II:glycine glycyltransferase FemX [Benzoatithermus flavus]|uniref:Peptidoglycan bridge formation glycyltransferase FemA/FemB family protein n=1 Tax=Benzoatithermus flavus TaxID=3108223 RepID=A0ABU8XLB9_9PROT